MGSGLSSLIIRAGGVVAVFCFLFSIIHYSGLIFPQVSHVRWGGTILFFLLWGDINLYGYYCRYYDRRCRRGLSKGITRVSIKHTQEGGGCRSSIIGQSCQWILYISVFANVLIQRLSLAVAVILRLEGLTCQVRTQGYVSMWQCMYV